MNVLSKDDLTTLLEERPGWHLWMFMPMARRGAATQQNPIRCKTVLRQAEAQLLSRGAPPRDVQELLQPVQQLVPDQVFWQRQQEGLALFRAPNVFQAYRLPFPLGESIAVTQRFQIKPLLPLLSDDGHFFVLALSQKAVRLFQGTRYSISEVELQVSHRASPKRSPMGMLRKRATTTQAPKVEQPEGWRPSPDMGWALKMRPMRQKMLFCATSNSSMPGYARF